MKPESETNDPGRPPGVLLQPVVSLREKAEASLHHWMRILEDAEQFRTSSSVNNAREQIVWLRGYLRGLDDASQANK